MIAKKAPKVSRIRRLLEQENRDKVSRFPYIVPEKKLDWLFLDVSTKRWPTSTSGCFPTS
jgi:hypothetical protein